MTDAPPTGLVVVDKSGGMTSHDVVARTRRLAGTRKVGHAGTLDPMATGVLVLGVGRATRLLGHLMLTEKAYDATIRLGAVTSTDDAEGELLASTPAGDVDEVALRSVLASFVGHIEQRPSAVSAIKVDGKRAYQRVRDGETVELPARPVTIHEIVVGGVRRGGETVDVDVSVRCSSGTYIRALARDLGERLAVGGHLTALRRTAVGGFDLEAARTLEQLADELVVVPLEAAARATFPCVELGEQETADVRVGRTLVRSVEALTAVFSPQGEFLALYEPTDEGCRPVAVFTG